MKGPARLIGRIILVLLCAGLVLCCAQESTAQLNRISVSISGGAGYLPLKDWEDFATSISSSHFEKDKFGSYLDLRAVYHLTDRHAVALNVESINTSASLYHAMALTGPTGDTSGYASSVIKWDFSAIPVGLSYEFHPMRSDESTSPFLGFGVSYFFSEVEYKSWFLHDGFFGDLGSKGARDGEGYGVHAYAGVQCQLTEQLLVVSRLRGRYADGMGFTDEEGAVKVEFTGVDFTLGLGWRF
jgi:outer membrane protein W